MASYQIHIQISSSIQPSSTGQDLLDVVIKHLNLLETSYFGLRYIDQSSIANSSKDYGSTRLDQVWLDMKKNIIKQLRDVQPMTVYFGVKYYASDPCKLAEEITRYQFFLQCKQDILHSRLPVSFELAIELFALAVQSELGDFDPQIHHEGYVSEFQFLPNQTVDLERRVAAYHRKLNGQVPATAEMNFLDRVKWLDLYGCELHPIQYNDEEREEYALGLNPNGVLVLRNRIKVAQYQWSRVTKAKCQGRCFLMDVVDHNDSSNISQNYDTTTSNLKQQNSESVRRHRFGFRLADKRLAQRLLWSFEAHKSFQHLVHNSATLNQLAQRQQMKFSQKFRNSIRSAINVVHAQQQQYNSFRHQQQQQQQQRTRSSIKAKPQLLDPQQSVIQQQHYSIDRAPPTVVRMPSRRYSNRSTSSRRPQSYRAPPDRTNPSANGNGLPMAPAFKIPHHPSEPGISQTMVESQRQQALLMMSQLRDPSGGYLGKSQTLRPIPVSMKESKKNLYHQQMMNMMVAAAQQQRNLQQTDNSILSPSQHLIQPTIYRTSSVINGLDQLGPTNMDGRIMAGLPAHLQTRPLPVPDRSAANLNVMQLFCGQPIPMAIHQRGHESPRSTKSAIAPSSAMKLASKKLMQQQLFNQRHATLDETPLLLASDATHRAHLYPSSTNANRVHYPVAYNVANICASANVSPKSVRSGRISHHHRSKSTNENLHLLPGKLDERSHNDVGPNLLLTTANSMGPPPGYNSKSDHSGKYRQQSLMKMSALDGGGLLLDTGRLVSLEGSKNRNLRPRSMICSKQRKASFATDEEEPEEDEDDCCCSRSDCSSIVERKSSQYCRRSSTSRNDDNISAMNKKIPLSIDDRQEWDAIRKRHNEFSSGEGLFARQYQQDHNNNSNNTINSNCGRQVVKNIAIKQATPILLSMNYVDSKNDNSNSKAVQMLNLQRQQLQQHNSSGQTHEPSAKLGNVLTESPRLQSSQSSSPQSASSVASSLKSAGPTSIMVQTGLKSSMAKIKATSQIEPPNSAGSSANLTTSGYYEGSSNSTGSTSLDSDSHTRLLSTGSNSEWRDESSRVAKVSINNLKIDDEDGATNNKYRGSMLVGKSNTAKQQYMLDDPPDSKSNQTNGRQITGWSSPDQQHQQTTTSMKYVSFDV